MLGFFSCGKPILEGCVEASAVVDKKVAERTDPISPMLHCYFALVRPVMACFVIWVAVSSVCIWEEVVPTCVRDVGEHDDL